MNFKIDWIKLKNFLIWLIDWRFEELAVPVKCRIKKINEKSLAGKAYYFCDLKHWEIKSPFEGTVSKIYPSYAIQIINQEGLQILIDIQVDKKNPIPLERVFQCRVEEGQKISTKTNLFIVYSEEQVISVSVYIPWQPEIIGRIKSLKKDDFFAKIYYRNPYSKLSFKKHGDY
jgi:hypothetical protein